MLLKQTGELILKIESHLPSWLQMSFWIGLAVLIITGYSYAIGSLARFIAGYSNSFVGDLAGTTAVILTIMILFSGED